MVRPVSGVEASPSSSSIITSLHPTPLQYQNGYCAGLAARIENVVGTILVYAGYGVMALGYFPLFYLGTWLQNHSRSEPQRPHRD